jgi:hypothetical protein
VVHSGVTLLTAIKKMSGKKSRNFYHDKIDKYFYETYICQICQLCSTVNCNFYETGPKYLDFGFIKQLSLITFVK